MDLLETMLIHVAVYWGPSGIDDHGNKKFLAPIEVKARWEKNTRLLLDEKGNVTAFMSKVYVDRDVEELGVLWLSKASPDDTPGTALGQVPSNAKTSPYNPFKAKAAAEIRKFSKIPTIDGGEETDEVARICYL